ncbi:MAG: redoxin domain-containing protein [Pedobacter sp.]|nr:redoxin domain-containing protein [Pedobacter sp.]
MKYQLIFVWLFLASLNINAKTLCKLKGEVYNRSSKEIYLFKASENIRKFPEKMKLLKVNNNKFEYSFQVDQIEPYVVVFKDELDNGAYKKIVFFPNDEVVLKLYAFDEFEDKTLAIGGLLNQTYYQLIREEYKIYKDETYVGLLKGKRELETNNQYFSTEMMVIHKQLSQKSKETATLFAEQKMLVDKGNDLTELGKENKRRIDSLFAINYSHKYVLIDRNINLAAYYLLINDLQRAEQFPFLKQLIKGSSEKFISTFTSHNYSAQLKTFLESQDLIKDKGRFIDFEAENGNGVTVKISSLFHQNKLILLNFWGSWCGPCLAKMEMVYPIYEQYKNRGFDVISIAREFKTLTAWRNRIKANGYYWQNIVDLDDKYDVWNKYGILNSVGKMLLIDQNGAVIAYDPTPKAIEDAIKKYF